MKKILNKNKYITKFSSMTELNAYIQKVANKQYAQGRADEAENILRIFTNNEPNLVWLAMRVAFLKEESRS